ncbi:c-type cytochrome [Henriciella litoralis]|uniref:c-type cytochrome n=1 Tax=Henriciella litoralis TaxID=568102 RepID=UPI00146BCD40|nr:cytochrome c [Henriciella litoralis]
MKIRTFAFLTVAAVGLLSACGEDSAEVSKTDAADADPALVEQVEARQANFQDMGAAFKAINDELKAGRPDSTTTNFSIDSVVRYGGQVQDWFPVGSGPELGIKMEAKAVIWEEPEDFEARLAQFEEALIDLDAAKGGDAETVQAAFRKTGAACKACHDKYREED